MDDVDAIAQTVGDLVAKMMDVHHDIGNAVLEQPIDRAFQQGTAGYRDQRLGHGVGERPHVFATAGGQDHGACYFYAVHVSPTHRSENGSMRSTRARKSGASVVLPTLGPPCRATTSRGRSVVASAVAVSSGNECKKVDIDFLDAVS